jgi:hypothetical protein
MSASLYATLIFDYPRDNSFPGCNKAICDTTEALDGQCVEVRETRFKFEPRRVRLYVEIYTSHSTADSFANPITDEDSMTSHIENLIVAAGLPSATILPDVLNSDLVPKSELEPA